MALCEGPSRSLGSSLQFLFFPQLCSYFSFGLQKTKIPKKQSDLSKQQCAGLKGFEGLGTLLGNHLWSDTKNKGVVRVNCSQC